MVRLERREFLRALVVVAGPPVLVACGDDESAAPADSSPERYFPQSVASGDPRSESVVLWTRAVDPARDGADLLLTLVVATNAELTEVVSLAGAPSLDLVATAEHDGYEPHGSVVETNTEDWPFLVDSVSAEIQAHGARVQRMLHPIVGVERNGEEVTVTAVARSFLHSQVRSMVGSLEAVGEGKWSADDLSRALAARDRIACGPVAPPDGLYLVRVEY